MKKVIILLMAILVLSLISCKEKDQKLTVKDIEIFKNTPAWDLAVALDNSNLEKAKDILSANQKLVNYKDPEFGTTLLMRAVSKESYRVVEFLLKNGADPNIKSKTGTTALFRAVSYPWDDVNASDDTEILRALLQNGADPNTTYCGEHFEKQTDPIECGTSALMHAASRGLNKAKLLVSEGANINYKTESGKTAAIRALVSQSVEVAHFLIVEKKANVSEPYYFYEFNDNTKVNYDKPHLPIETLEYWLFELGSEEHKKKMEIVEEFGRQGQNYWSMERHPKTVERIKKLYPDSWEAYLAKY